MSQYPLGSNVTVSYTDEAINSSNPGMEYAGTESGAIYFEDREIAGTMYRVQNATFNKFSQSWLLIDSSKPAYATALVDGVVRVYTSAAGVTPFTSWSTYHDSPSCYNVKAFGAKGDGTTDDTSAIQAAINAAAANSGGLVYFPGGIYNITATLKITTSNIELAGESAGASAISGGANAAFDAIHVLGTDNGNGRIYHVTIRDLTIQQTAAPSTGNAAIFMQYVVLGKLVDVIISQWGAGVNLNGTTDHFSERVYITTANATSANVYGYFIDGGVQNASCFLSHCIAAHGSYAGTGHSYSYYIFGAHIADLYLHFCESDLSHYGLYVSPSGGAAYDILDIHLYQFVADQHTINCIYINNLLTDSGMLRIDGGWCSPGANSMSCVSVNSSSGIVLDGLQIYALATRTGCTAISISGSDNFVVRDNVIKNVQNGISLTGGSLGTVAGNKLYATSAQSGTAINSTTPRTAIIGNTISGISTGWSAGINLASGADYNTVQGNAIDPASISGAAISNNTANPHSIITGNPGYNPVGASIAQPSIGPSPWTYSNNTGVPVYLCVSGGTVSSITVAGKTTGQTAGMVAVPPGLSAVVTYSVAPTVTAIGT